jgi:hypothetical protein
LLVAAIATAVPYAGKRLTSIALQESGDRHLRQVAHTANLARYTSPMAKKIKIDAAGLVVLLTAGEGAEIEMTVSNPTGERRVFCTYHTPFEGIRNDIFEVHRADSGEELEYAGMMAKRAAPGPEDFITLAPNGYESAAVDLTDGYDFPVSGDYTVHFPGNMISGLPASNDVMVTVPASGE